MAGNDPGTFIDSGDRDLQTSLATSPIQQPSLQPVAKTTPIRYAVPAIARDDNLTNLARSLQGLSGDLDSFMDARDKQQNQADVERAQADAITGKAPEYASAVAAGTIPASASPAYVNAYKTAQGQLYGQNLEQRFQAAYDNWGGKDNLNDPDAYSKFAQDFMARNIGTSDPAVLKGLLPVIHEITNNGLKQNIEHQHQTVVQGYSDAQSAVVNNSIAGAVAYANSSGNPVDPNYIAKAVGDTYTQARGLGVKDEVAQRNAIIQITTAALLNKEHHGDEVLKALDVPLPGSNLILSQTPFGAEQKLKVTNDLEAYQHTQVVRETGVQKATEKAALGAVESRVLDGLAKDPTAPVSEADIKEAETMGNDPTFRNRALEWQERFQKQAEHSDPTAIMGLTRDIMGGAGMDAVRHAVDTKVILTLKDLKDMQEQVKEHAAADPIMKDVVTSEAYKAVMGSIKSQTAATGAADPFGQVGLTQTGLGVQYELNKRMQTWAAANPGATYNDAQDQLAKTSADVLKLITHPKDPMFGGVATLPAGNPYATQPQAPAAPAPAPVPGTPAPSPAAPSSTSSTSSSPLASASTLSSSLPSQPSSASAPSPSITGSTPATAVGSADPAKVQAWMNALSPEQQQNLARQALKTGKAPQELAALAYMKTTAGAASTAGQLPASTSTGSPPATGGSGGTASPFGSLAGQTAKIAYQPGAAQQFGDAVAKWRASDPNAEQTIHQLTGVLQGLHASLPYTGSTTVAAIKDNPQAAHILDFVAGPESGGNYNAYYGHAGSTKDLSGMTLNQVLQFQHDLVHVDGLPSSATGRYQFMPQTLQGLMKQMGLNGSERFTPEMQDNLALQLLKNRGMEQWQQGKLSDQQFMNNLAYEWASLPNVNTGRSQYDKDGLNKSLVTVPQVGKMIEEARGLNGAAAPKPAYVGAQEHDYTTPKSQIAQGDTAMAAGLAPSSSSTTASANSKPMTIGDSIGDGVKASIGGDGDTRVGRPPAEVLQRIQALPDKALAGRPLILSSGMSNNPTENIATVGKQIDAAIAKGAKPGDIKLLGVGDRADFKSNSINQKLIALAAERGVSFVPLGALPPGEHVHPNTKGYADIAARAMKNATATDGMEEATAQE